MRKSYNRRGAVIILAVFLLVVLLAFCAFAIDVGYMCIVRTEAQASVDSAALAAALDMVNEERLSGDHATVFEYARASGTGFAALNRVAKQSSKMRPYEDIVIGRLNNASNLAENLSFGDPAHYNAVQVTLHCTEARNQAAQLFFARVMGLKLFDTKATATAAFMDNIKGFRATDKTGNSSLLPFTVLINDWEQYCLGQGGADEWHIDENTGKPLPGGDGIPEMLMFPGGPDGNSETPGNWGTIDFGDTGNSTSDLSRQIRDGLNASDMALMGGEVSIPDTGPLRLNGDTGMSVGMSDAVSEILGNPRTIPLYEAVSSQGNVTWYDVIGFAGIRILDYKLTGGNKYILIQPAFVSDKTAITDSDADHSYFVGQPVHLVR